MVNVLLRRYLLYFLYIVRHKQYVLRECRRCGILGRGLTHDLSKFLPDEFLAYAEYWIDWGWPKLRDPSVMIPNEVNRRFRLAAYRHKRRNRHHPEHWLREGSDGALPTDMDHDSVLEMICDWEGVGRMFKATAGARDWYERHGSEMALSPKTRLLVERLLDRFAF